jgi:alkanesulfonate monooxygenase SsuD/methylene tetrahydromethanopterin reductase-like flavin-dependent oxidoreductase (luciferase family)
MKVGVALLFQNATEMDRFEAMERGEEVGPPITPDSSVMADQLALGDLVEPLGYNSLWTFEHRTSPYIMLPNPQQFIAYFAGRTERIDFGTMVTVVPWHNPVRLAENLSLLTHMLGPNRRVRMGVGRGLARREYAMMGISMEESRARFSEGLDIIRRAFHEEMFSYKSDIFDFQNVRVRPRPLSTDIVDEIYAVWTSHQSLEAAASAGLHPLTIPSKDLEAYKDEIGTFDDVRAAHGMEPSKPPILQLFMYCDRDGDKAREIADKYVGEYSDVSSRHYEFGGSHFDNIKGYESYRKGGDSRFDVSEDRRQAALGSKTRVLREGLIGTPEECIAKVERIENLMHPSEIVLVSTPGSLPKELAAESLKLFSEEALPTIQKIGHPA